MNGFHTGGSKAYRKSLKEDYARRILEIDEQLDRAGVDQREALQRRKSELQQELKTKLAEADRMIH